MHEVLVNHFGGLGLARKSVIRLTDRPDMSIDVNRGHETTTQQQHKMPLEGDSNKHPFSYRWMDAL